MAGVKHGKGTSSPERVGGGPKTHEKKSKFLLKTTRMKTGLIRKNAGINGKSPNLLHRDKAATKEVNECPTLGFAGGPCINTKHEGE